MKTECEVCGRESCPSNGKTRTCLSLGLTRLRSALAAAESALAVVTQERDAARDKLRAIVKFWDEDPEGCIDPTLIEEARALSPAEGQPPEGG